MAGLFLDEWQRDVLVAALGETSEGRWAAGKVGVMVSRQNGKGALLEARALAGLFLLGERLIIHSAHEAATAVEAFRRLCSLIEANDDLMRRVARVSRAHGQESIELLDGSRIWFRTRTKGGGRGFSSDCLILDEAMFLSEAQIGAIIPTLSARPNPQVWYTGSAVDQTVHDEGRVFARIRDEGHRREGSLAYFEWSLDVESPDRVDDEQLEDVGVWAATNPGFGIRITEQYVRDLEFSTLGARNFAVERLGVGDWPIVDGDVSVIDLELWRSLVDEGSSAPDPVVFALDVSPSRSSSSIAVAGLRADQRFHVELVEQRKGTGWVVSRAKALQDKHGPSAFVVDGRSPAASLLHDLEEAGVRVTTCNSSEHAQACGLLYDLVEQRQVRHLGQPELRAALKGAAQRPLGDAWAWSRRNSSADITPLVSATLALWGAATLEGRSVYEDRGLLVLGR